jgi:RimJ/RimL family protein N-acetyltransferase
VNTLNLKKKLSNSKLFLIPVSFFYFKDFHEYSVDKKFYKYFEYDSFKTKKESRAYIQKMIRLSKKKNIQFWFIVLKKLNKCIGTISIKIDINRNSGELGYGLNPKFWGNGYFSLSLKTLEKFLFLHIKLKRLFAITFSSNFRSVNKLIKLGYKIEGKMKCFYKKKNNYIDSIILAKINNK